MKKISKMSFAVFVLSLVLVSSASCGSDKPQNEGGNADTNPAASLWIKGMDLISKVEVLSGGSTIETYEFSYDKYARLTSLVKRDLLGQSKLLDLKFSYAGKEEMDISGTYYMMTSPKKTVAKIDEESNSVSYVGDWVGAWTYTTSYDDCNTVLSTEAVVDFAAVGGYYSHEVVYKETYNVVSNDVATATLGTDTASQSSYSSASQSSTNTVISYTYSGNLDNCNFNVFLVNCEFPVWFAKELPGCTHLIKGMTSKCGEVVSPMSFTVDYKFNEDSQVIEAVRKDYEGKNLVLERIYRITYL